MPYKPNMPPKMNTIYLLWERKKYASVKLKDGRKIICRADCYCYVGDDMDEDVLALHVLYKNSIQGEIITEEDIDEVKEA